MLGDGGTPMAHVNGVLGPIASEDLGFTLMHEHVLIANWAMRQCYPDYVDADAHVELASGEVKTALERGVRTLVDLTPVNLGRDIDVIRRVAERSGAQIIAATGFYWHEEPWMEAWPVEKLADYLIRDIEQGIEGTSARAGIIKCATDRLGVTEFNRKLLQVAAQAHRATGVPISTHTAVAEATGPLQQDVFEEAGVDLSRVVIGHCGDSTDIAYLESILRRGSFIGMDRFGLDMILPGKQRVSTIAELCRRGWAGQMVLSHDACCHIDWFPKEMIQVAAPRWNFRHICDDVIPALREEGVGDESIRQMTVENPRRVFEAQGAY
jgi:phosphotriesterase-related protein